MARPRNKRGKELQCCLCAAAALLPPRPQRRGALRGICAIARRGCSCGTKRSSSSARARPRCFSRHASFPTAAARHSLPFPEGVAALRSQDSNSPTHRHSMPAAPSCAEPGARSPPSRPPPPAGAAHRPYGRRRKSSLRPRVVAPRPTHTAHSRASSGCVWNHSPPNCTRERQRAGNAGQRSRQCKQGDHAARQQGANTLTQASALICPGRSTARRAARPATAQPPGAPRCGTALGRPRARACMACLNAPSRGPAPARLPTRPAPQQP